jgi:malate synthase
VLTPEALAFLAELHGGFDESRRALLERRAERQQALDAGALPGFREDTAELRAADWSVDPIPPELLDRRVEITGPVDRKMIINALNSGARVFMADFEDATSPTWANLIDGQANLIDRWSGRLHVTDPATGKDYRLGPDPAVLMVRPRGWALEEAHLQIEGRSIAGALFDYGLYAFHNARAAAEAGSGAYFYLPKLESAAEAELWNAVFDFTEDRLSLGRGRLKATVLIETLPAAFEMDEILWALRTHVVGLNCGRWDYIFSFIKRLGRNPAFLTPDRSRMVMGEAFLRAYSELLVATCHRRGAFAMGGMAAQIPIKRNAEANSAAFAKVRADKEREVRAGHDGTWVAHPDLVPVATAVFDAALSGPNQLHHQPEVRPDAEALLRMHVGSRTEAGLRENIRVGVLYVQAWLNGRGAVPLYDLMEDAATAEISRVQIWQWLFHVAALEDGRAVTPRLFERLFAEELAALEPANDAPRLRQAAELFRELVLAPDCAEFLTEPAYRLLLGDEAG